MGSCEPVRGARGCLGGAHGPHRIVDSVCGVASWIIMTQAPMAMFRGEISAGARLLGCLLWRYVPAQCQGVPVVTVSKAQLCDTLAISRAVLEPQLGELRSAGYIVVHCVPGNIHFSSWQLIERPPIQGPLWPARVRRDRGHAGRTPPHSPGPVMACSAVARSVGRGSLPALRHCEASFIEPGRGRVRELHRIGDDRMSDGSDRTDHGMLERDERSGYTM